MADQLGVKSERADDAGSNGRPMQIDRPAESDPVTDYDAEILAGYKS